MFWTKKTWLVFFEGAFLLVGTIIGAGYLTLPYSFLKAGWQANVFWLLFFGFFLTILHLFYAEIISATKEHHRFPGYVGLYLGRLPEAIASISFFFGTLGSLLIYLLLGSKFFGLLLAPVLNLGQNWLVLIFALAMSLLVILRLNLSARINFFITTFNLCLFFFISLASLLEADWSNFQLAPTENFFFPFGLILYSLVGSMVIPEITKLLDVEGEKKSLIKPIIALGTILPVLIYLFFAISIFGASGVQTTQEAFSGLTSVLPVKFVFTGVLLAFLEIVTSYISFGINSIETLRKDFGFSKFSAKLTVALLPLLFFLIGINDFLKIMGFSGSILTAIDSIFLALMYLKLNKQNPDYQFQVIKAPKVLVWGLILIFALGGVLGFYYSL